MTTRLLPTFDASNEHPYASSRRSLSFLKLFAVSIALGTTLVGKVIISYSSSSSSYTSLRSHSSTLETSHQNYGLQNVPSSSSSVSVPRFLQETEECTESCCIDSFPCEECEECEESAASSNPFAMVPEPIQYIMIVLLISFSALFSGLTLGIMGLDKTGLDIVMNSDDPVQANYARKIYPVRENGNLLLCTLLLGNVAVNALLSILLADKAGGIVGFLSSTFLIVIFGEIVPQAACSRYALEVGSFTIPIVKVIICILYPIAKPLSTVLDWALGEELATTYSGSEMLKLLQIHVQENVLDPDTAVAMTGAMQYRNMEVREVMTPLEHTFMLNVDEKLNFETIAKIFKTGYSRIPIYEISKNNVIGLLFVKDLIFIDPEDATRVADFVEIFGRGLHVVWLDDKLGDVLRELKTGRSHMALVRDVKHVEDKDPIYEIKGIITLEDIIEEILGDEIMDETDLVETDGGQNSKSDRAETFKWARLRLLDSKIVDETLSLDETRAVVAHLLKNYPSVVSLLTEKQLHRLIAESPVTLLPTAEQEVGEELPKDLLYAKGKPTDKCTLILAGKITVVVGEEKFRSDVSSWCLLAGGAMESSMYRPDFSAYVSAGPCRCLQINRHRFAVAIDASTYERTGNPAPYVNNDLSTNHTITDSTHDYDMSTSTMDISDRSRSEKMMYSLKLYAGNDKKQSDYEAEDHSGSYGYMARDHRSPKEVQSMADLLETRKVKRMNRRASFNPLMGADAANHNQDKKNKNKEKRRSLGFPIKGKDRERSVSPPPPKNKTPEPMGSRKFEFIGDHSDELSPPNQDTAPPNQDSAISANNDSESGHKEAVGNALSDIVSDNVPSSEEEESKC